MLNKIFLKKTDLPHGKSGMQAIVRDGPGYVIYVYIDNKWWKTGNALDPIANGDGQMLIQGTRAPKGVFSTIELQSPPSKPNEIGLLKTKIGSRHGGLGDTQYNFGFYNASSSATAGWIFVNGDVSYNTGSTDVTVDSTVSLGHHAAFGSHYKTLGFLAPYTVQVFGISYVYGDTLGLSSDSYYQRASIWTADNTGAGSISGNSGTGNKTYTLKNVHSTQGPISAGTVNINTRTSKENVDFVIVAGDYVQLAIQNTEWSTGKKYFKASVTLYCKYK